MIQKIKIYFEMKRMSKKLRYTMLTYACKFINNYEGYLVLINQLAEIPPEEMKEKLFSVIAETASLSPEDK